MHKLLDVKDYDDMDQKVEVEIFLAAVVKGAAKGMHGKKKHPKSINRHWAC